MGRNERVLYHGHDSITYPFQVESPPQELEKYGMDVVDLKEQAPEEPPVKQRNVWTRMLHSFKRQEQKEQTVPSTDPEFGIPRSGDTSQLHRKLKSRHIQMIAIGGAIGAGLFIGSGKALSTGGPGAVVLDFSLIGFMLFCTVNALGELATLFPIQGRSFGSSCLIQALSRFSLPDLSIPLGGLRWAGIMRWDG
jgi:Amino acid permease